MNNDLQTEKGRIAGRLSQLESVLQAVRSEYAEFQKTKKIEDLITVKFEVDSLNTEFLASAELDIGELESHKATIETRIS